MSSKTDYWLELCDEDIITAKALLDAGRFLHMGYFCHQIIEKALKAVIADISDEIPPKVHDLPKLAKLADVINTLSNEQKLLLSKLLPLQIEARYPEYKSKVSASLSREYCNKLLTETEEFLCWIKKRLGR